MRTKPYITAGGSNQTVSDEPFVTNSSNHSHGELTLLTTLRRTLLITSICLALPVVAMAQSPNNSTSGFVGVLGGLTLGTTTSTGIAGNAGIRVAPDVFVIGEIGFMRNVTPKEINDQIDDFNDALEAQLGVPVTLEISVPQLYGFGGLRWNPSRGRVSPFVEGGVGFGRISMKVDRAEVQDIDIRDEVEDAIRSESTSSTALLFAVGGGVNATISKSTSIDVGVRYTRTTVEDPSINTIMVYGAVKFGL